MNRPKGKAHRWYPFQKIVGILVVLSLLLVTFAGAVSAQDRKIDGEVISSVTAQEFVPGEIIVGFEPGVNAQRIEAVARKMKAQVVHRVENLNIALFRLSQDAGIESALTNLPKEQGVRFAERNGIARIPEPANGKPLPKEMLTGGEAGIASITNDPTRSYQWQLHKIKEDWTTIPASAPVVAVVDTGVDYNHVDLAGKVYLGRDYYNWDNDPMDDNGHGTHVAGIIAAKANNAQFGAGVSPTSPILAVKVLGSEGSGSYFAITAGVSYAAGVGAVKVINMSLGGASPSAALELAINSATAAGKLVVVAAGNSNLSSAFYPAYYTNSFAVAATEERDARTYFSNSGTSGTPWVDIAAPGWNIPSTTPGNMMETMSGTSMAAPVVSGAAARVWAAFPGYTPAQVRNRLVTLGDATTGFPYSMKRVNLYRALTGLLPRGIAGIISDGSAGRPLSGALVSIYRWNGSSWVTVTSTTTSGDGFYQVKDLPVAGTYRVYASKTNYVALTQNVSVGITVVENVNLALERVRDADDWTFVVEWKTAQPKFVLGTGTSSPTLLSTGPGWDLDTYLKLPDTSRLNPYNNQGTLAGAPYAQIGRDSYNDSRPMESAIIRSVATAGVYKLSVDNYIGDFATSGAVVRIYRGSYLKNVVSVSTATGTGSYWYVADVNTSADVVTVKNVLQAGQP